MKDSTTLYATEGCVTNARTVVSVIRDLCSELKTMTDDEVTELLNKNLEKSTESTIYFGEKYESLNDAIGSSYKWLSTGLTDFEGTPIYAQFYKGDYEWLGAIAGTPNKILNFRMNQIQSSRIKKEMQRNIEIWKRNNGLVKENKVTVENAPAVALTPKPVPPVPRPVPKVSVPEVKKPLLRSKTIISTAPANSETNNDALFDSEKPFYNDFYDKMLCKVGWSPELIKNYLYTMVMRLNYLLSNKRGQEYIIRSRVTDGKTYVLINTALLNNLGFPIKLIVEEHAAGHTLGYDARYWKICGGKESLLKYGFTKEDGGKELPPVVYYENDPSELVFSAEVDDFDLENEHRLSHCIDRKLERDVDGFNELSPNQLYSSIVEALRTAVKISRYDKNFIKPMYNRGKNEINFVIPYHTNGRFDSTPELGILVAKSGYGLWQVMTILDYENVVKDCNCLSPYRASTF